MIPEMNPQSEIRNPKLTDDDRMPFGRFTGECLAVVDKGYWREMLMTDWFPVKFPQLAEYARNRRGVLRAGAGSAGACSRFGKARLAASGNSGHKPPHSKSDPAAAARALDEFKKFKATL
jgi:hypothetical protein